MGRALAGAVERIYFRDDGEREVLHALAVGYVQPEGGEAVPFSYELDVLYASDEHGKDLSGYERRLRLADLDHLTHGEAAALSSVLFRLVRCLFDVSDRLRLFPTISPEPGKMEARGFLDTEEAGDPDGFGFGYVSSLSRPFQTTA